MKRPFCHLNKKRHLVFWVVWCFQVNKKRPLHLRKLTFSIRVRSTDLIIKPTGTPSRSLNSSDRTRCILHKQLSMFFRRYHGCWDTVPDSYRLPLWPCLHYSDFVLMILLWGRICQYIMEEKHNWTKMIHACNDLSDDFYMICIQVPDWKPSHIMVSYLRQNTGILPFIWPLKLTKG